MVLGLVWSLAWAQALVLPSLQQVQKLISVPQPMQQAWQLASTALQAQVSELVCPTPSITKLVQAWLSGPKLAFKAPISPHSITTAPLAKLHIPIPQELEPRPQHQQLPPLQLNPRLSSSNLQEPEQVSISHLLVARPVQDFKA